MPPTPAPIAYTVEIESVRELNLVGRADLAYWAAHLAGTGLTPLAVDGQAELSLGVTDLKWAGLRFNESIVVLSLAEAAAPQAAAGGFLVHAFNSRRSLAFMERAFFQTPYYPAAIQLHDQPPARFAVADGAGGKLAAQAGQAAPAAPTPMTDWVGAVHLPRQRTAPQQRGGYFYVKLAGTGQAYPFRPGVDSFAVTPSAASPVLGWLLDSHFTPREWRHRPGATHGKSRTYRAV